MSVTIKDIARMLNVSHTTVSRALNDSPLISEETKAKVKEAAKKYNYVPNVNARRLVTSRSYNIGLFFTTINKGTTANFFMDTIKGINSIIEGFPDRFRRKGLVTTTNIGKITPCRTHLEHTNTRCLKQNSH